MNIYLLLEALSETEKDQLKDHFLKQESAKIKQEADTNGYRVTVVDFLKKHGHQISVRLANVLESKDYRTGEPVFNYIDEIDQRRFFKIRNAGMKSWQELQHLLAEHGFIKNN